MITIGKHIQTSIDHMGRGDVNLALSEVCIALDATSQLHFQTTKSSRSNYKKFVAGNMWLITYMGFPGLMSSTLRIPFPNITLYPQIKPDAAGNIGIEDIVYHVIRCGLLHGSQNKFGFEWSNVLSIGFNQNTNELLLSTNLIWGLIGAVIFAEVNKNEVVPDNYHY